MKNRLRRIGMLMLTLCMLGATVGCGEENSKKDSVDTKEVANDYYLDLTDLGMKLTLYLRLDDRGNFLFSNTLAFEVNKSSGTFQKSGDEYIMVYETVNGEEKSLSEGLTSSFTVEEDGSLDFTGCERIYYGSARATTTSEDNPDARLTGRIVTTDYIEPDRDTVFEKGTYKAQFNQDGISYEHWVSFFEDNTYLHTIGYEKDGKTEMDYETGTYGVSTSQLAMEPEDGSRSECQVIDGENLKLSVLAYDGAGERTMLDFVKAEKAEQTAVFTGNGIITGTNETFPVEVVLYGDGSCEITAGEFKEQGLLVLDSKQGYMKQYPDHPESGVRGLSQVATVPAGSMEENGKKVLKGLRVRISDGLSRYECTVSEL